MREEGVPGKTDRADLLTLPYMVTFLTCYPARPHVQQDAELTVAVVDDDMIAKSDGVHAIGQRRVDEFAIFVGIVGDVIRCVDNRSVGRSEDRSEIGRAS